MSTIVNGQIYDYGDVEVTFIAGGALRVLPVESVSYSAPRESQAKYGHQRRPVGRTKGRVEPQFEVSMLKEYADELLQLLNTANGAAYGGTFGISVRYGTGSQPRQVDELKDCQIDDIQGEASDGTDGLVVTFPGKCNDIVFNGVGLFPATA